MTNAAIRSPAAVHSFVEFGVDREREAVSLRLAASR
jgi:hypothetical protein